MREVYQNEEDTNVVEDTLEEMVREGARLNVSAAFSMIIRGHQALDNDPTGRSLRMKGQI